MEECEPTAVLHEVPQPSSELNLNSNLHHLDNAGRVMHHQEDGVARGVEECQGHSTPSAPSAP